MKIQKLSIAITLLNLLVLVGVLLSLNQKTDNGSKYVDVIQLYQNFDLTKELEQRYDRFVLGQQAISDSLEMRVMQMQGQSKSGNFNEQEFMNHYQAIHQKLSAIDASQLEMKSEFEKQIWAQLNNYIEQFGVAHSYKVIHGATGQGSLLYADDELNITDEMSTYINNKYQGKS